MPVSTLKAATRALVSVLLVLSRSYFLTLVLNRDSSPEQLLKAYRKVLLKVHPDKGGTKEEAQRLQVVKENWDKARKASTGKAVRRRFRRRLRPLRCLRRRRPPLRRRLRLRLVVFGSGARPQNHTSRDESSFRVCLAQILPIPLFRFLAWLFVARSADQFPSLILYNSVSLDQDGKLVHQISNTNDTEIKIPNRRICPHDLN